MERANTSYSQFLPVIRSLWTILKSIKPVGPSLIAHSEATLKFGHGRCRLIPKSSMSYLPDSCVWPWIP